MQAKDHRTTLGLRYISAKKAWMALLALHQFYLLFLEQMLQSRIIYIDREIVSRPDK